MICIAITAEAYEAVARTLALGTVAVEPQLNKRGERLIWIEERWLDKLNSIRRSEAIIRLAALTHRRRWKLAAQRGPGKSYCEVIVRLAAAERG
jgi:hypothetical protein